MRGIIKACICLTLFVFCSGIQLLSAQDSLGLDNLKKWSTAGGKVLTIDSIAVEGSAIISEKLIINFSGLKVGSKFLYPSSDNISRAIKAIYAKGAFSDVKIFATKVTDDHISLLIKVGDRPRLSGYNLIGVTKSQDKDLNPKLGLSAGRPITQSMIDNAVAAIKAFFVEKGFNFTKVDVITTNTNSNNKEFVKLTFNVMKGKKVRVYDVTFWGNEKISPYALAPKMKKTREQTRLTLFPKYDYNSKYGKKAVISFKDYLTYWGFLSFSKTVKFLEPYVNINIFNPSKFSEKEYDNDKKALIEYYNELGFRDAVILHDSVYQIGSKLLNINIELIEGRQYVFGNIEWKGNYKFSDTVLSSLLGIKKGDPYNREFLNKKIGLSASQDGSGSLDIMSLYMDNGYLFFRIDPLEKRVYNDTIDFEMRIVEGPVATINEIKILGNDVTKERVIRRALRILPGDKFDRSALIRSVREMANLGFLNPEKINPQPKPNVENGTVDILFNVEEKSNDQIEASISYGGQYIGITGSIGVTLKNFSIQQLFAPKKYRNGFIPRGDAQVLSINTRFNGPQYQSISASFSEPWIGTSYRRTSFSLGVNYTNYWPNAVLSAAGSSSAYDQRIQNMSASVGFGTQLRWPDDYFVFSYGLLYTYYILNNYPLSFGIRTSDGSVYSDGTSQNIAFKLGISRSSIDNPIFPRGGSSLSFNADLTPPYSIIDRAIEKQPVEKQMSFIEYYKLTYDAEWYVGLSKPHGPDKNKQLVLKLAARGGYLGRYNEKLYYSPFERFQLGDAGLATGGGFLGFDVIAHRGYFVYRNSDPTVNPEVTSTSQFFTIYNKYIMELRYPLSLSSSATIFVTSYLEMANGWYRLEEYNPFLLRKSVGVGIRFFLPIFGLLGFDYAIGIDRLTESSNSVFSAGKFSFILGMDPK